MKLLETYSRIDGYKFLIVFMMIVTAPFLVGLLPLLILSGPMQLIWSKKKNRTLWRIGSSLWLFISILVGAYFTFGASREINDVLHVGFPLVSVLHRESFMGVVPGQNESSMVHGLNTAIITAVLMLPFTVASYFETRRRLMGRPASE